MNNSNERNAASSRRRILELTTHELAVAAPRLCFWAVGTIEAHDQGPLGTDVIAPEKLVEDLAAEFDAYIVPTLPFGLVSSLAGYPGGMWMSGATYRALVAELLASLTASRVREVVIFNGHGGNSAALGEVLPGLWKDHGLKAACVDWWTVCADLAEQYFGAAAGHGGADELALVRAADPALAPDKWDGSRSCRQRAGVKTCPAPRSAIRYGDGAVRPLTAASADDFYAAARSRVREVVAEIVAGWVDLDEARGARPV